MKIAISAQYKKVVLGCAAFLGVSAALIGCGAFDKKEAKLANVSVVAQGISNQVEANSDSISIQSSMPSSVTGFNCLVLNVTGAAGVSVQSGLGLVSSMIPVSNGGIMSVSVPQGAGITFQVLGVKTSASCGSVTRDMLLSTTTYTVIAELGRTVASISQDTELTIASSYNASTATDVRGTPGPTATPTPLPIGSAPVRPVGCLDNFQSLTAMSIYHQYGAAIEVGSNLYIIGGKTAAAGNTTSGTPTNKIFRIPIASDGTPGSIVDTGYTLTAARYAHRVEKVGNYIYAIGGLDGSDVGVSTVERVSVASGEIASNFSTVAGITLATARYNTLTLVTPGFLYVFGGGTQGGTFHSNTIERAPINTSTGDITATFQAIGQTLVVSRGTHNGMRLGDNFYVMGGEGAGNQSFDSVESFQINSDGTITNPANEAGITLGTARNRVQTVALSGKAYVFAGFDNGFLDSVAVSNITNNALGNFSVLGGVTLRNAVENVTSILTSKGVYVFGGYNNQAGAPHVRNHVQFAPIITCP